MPEYSNIATADDLLEFIATQAMRHINRDHIVVPFTIVPEMKVCRFGGLVFEADNTCGRAYEDMEMLRRAGFRDKEGHVISIRGSFSILIQKFAPDDPPNIFSLLYDTDFGGSVNACVRYWMDNKSSHGFVIIPDPDSLKDRTMFDPPSQHGVSIGISDGRSSFDVVSSTRVEYWYDHLERTLRQSK